jgi:hypothetical protein
MGQWQLWSNFCNRWKKKPGHGGSQEISEQSGGVIKVLLWKIDLVAAECRGGREREALLGTSLLLWTPVTLCLCSPGSLIWFCKLVIYLFIYSLPTNTLPAAEQGGPMVTLNCLVFFNYINTTRPYLLQVILNPEHKECIFYIFILTRCLTC